MPKWEKGQSGNPGGRPRGFSKSFKDKYKRKAIYTIIDIMEGRIDELAYDNKGIRVRVAASVKEVRESAKILLAYTIGTPAQQGQDEIEHRLAALEKAPTRGRPTASKGVDDEPRNRQKVDRVRSPAS